MKSLSTSIFLALTPALIACGAAEIGDLAPDPTSSPGSWTPTSAAPGANPAPGVANNAGGLDAGVPQPLILPCDCPERPHAVVACMVRNSVTSCEYLCKTGFEMNAHMECVLQRPQPADAGVNREYAGDRVPTCNSVCTPNGGCVYQCYP